MEKQIMEIAQRIRALREILNFSLEEMAVSTGVSAEEYRNLESGTVDFSFTFLYKCAEKFEVDLSDLLMGDSPKLSFYTVTRQGKGLPIKRRKGFSYQHLAGLMKDRRAEPFLVTAPYESANETAQIELSQHEGQEFDFILKGTLKVAMENHIEILNEGDAIFYDSSHGHGMIATGGADCTFLAVVIRKKDRREA